MNALWAHWSLSLATLKPRSLWEFFKRSGQTLGKALIELLKVCYGLFVIDSVLLIFFGKKMVDFTAQAFAKGAMNFNISLGLMAAALCVGIMGFFMQAFLVLLLRRGTILLNTRTYFQTYILRYFQFVCLSGMAMLLVVFLLVQGGVVPVIPAGILILAKIFEVLALFFWLDSNFTIKAFFQSYERAANLFVYTFPVILTIGFVSLILLGILFGCTLGWDKILTAPYAQGSFPEFFSEQAYVPTIAQILVTKYCRFLSDGFVVALVYVWYRRKRGFVYAATFFRDQQ